MSYARKTKGYRQITVAGKRYRWCFRSGPQDISVTLQGVKSGDQQAVAILRNYPDPWLAAPDIVRRILVTPRIVRRIVQQALAQGWQPTQRAAPVTFDYDPK